MKIIKKYIEKCVDNRFNELVKDSVKESLDENELLLKNITELKSKAPSGSKEYIPHLDSGESVYISSVDENIRELFPTEKKSHSDDDKVSKSDEEAIIVRFLGGHTNSRLAEDFGLTTNRVKSITKKHPRMKPSPSSLREVRDYIKERGYVVDPKAFYNYYEKTNWRTKSGSKLKNWKRALSGWNSRDIKSIKDSI